MPWAWVVIVVLWCGRLYMLSKEVTVHGAITLHCVHISYGRKRTNVWSMEQTSAIDRPFAAEWGMHLSPAGTEWRGCGKQLDNIYLVDIVDHDSQRTARVWGIKTSFVTLNWNTFKDASFSGLILLLDLQMFILQWSQQLRGVLYKIFMMKLLLGKQGSRVSSSWLLSVSQSSSSLEIVENVLKMCFIPLLPN